MKDTETLPNIEVGCGVASGDDSYTVGLEAAKQAMVSITTHPLSAVIIFASVSYQLNEMLSGVQSIVGDVPLFGSSSAAEICNRISSNSVVVMALASPFLKVKVGLGKRVSEDWQKAVQEAVRNEKLAPFFTPQNNAVYNEMTKEGLSCFSVLFSPGSTQDTDSKSPEILEELKRLSKGRVPFFGGAACDDMQTGGESNYVFHGNKAYSDSVVLAVFETSLQFGTAMGHGFHPTKSKVIATKVRDCEILELDGKPAADVFAELHDLNMESLVGKALFEQLAKPFGMRHVLGQYTLFVPRYLTPEKGILLAHPVPEGAQLFVMEAFEEEVIAAGRETLLRAMSQSGIGRPAVILVCSCFLRMHLLEGNIDKEISSINEIMPGVPVAGFYSAGEQGINDDHVSHHNNEAIVILLLGNELSYAARVAEQNRNLNRILEAQVAEQKRLERELVEQVHFLQTLIDNIPNPVFYKDPEGRYLGCNKALEKYLNVRREKILGKGVQDIPTADLIELHQKMDAELICKGGSVVYESKTHPKDGNAHHDIIHKALFHKADGSLGGIVSVITDITEQKHTEEALRTSEEKFMKAFQGNPTMMAISRISGEIIEINESHLKDFGLTRQEVIGKKALELGLFVHAEQYDVLRKTLKEQGFAQNLDLALRTKDGNIRHCLFSAERIELQGTEHMLVLLQDITDRKRAEEEQLHRIKLQNALEMAGTICHELNQPMQVLSGYTELLMSNLPQDEKYLGKLRIIKEQTKRVGIITEKLMALKDCSVKNYAGISEIIDIYRN
ncbi:PAS domain S-box-containing protein [Syntrophus gentianae]|uniref:histidine kinase n=1 Tax=Syntrophus gentianae TaxID=43775 RepID=A0A1H8BJS6_9BACT|nr:FIST N-terminal domain-containing protein [Syntrophus gentianae]SEM82137.1 PAS domain S-box-containing protein [Syntrophus gentianae]